MTRIEPWMSLEAFFETALQNDMIDDIEWRINP